MTMKLVIVICGIGLCLGGTAVSVSAQFTSYPRSSHAILEGNPWRDLPAPPLLAPLAGQLRLTRVFHAAWLDPRSAVQTFQSRDLFP